MSYNLQCSPAFFCCVLYNSSTACNVAVKILAPKFGRLSYHYSKAMRMDWFNGMLKYRLLDSWISLKLTLYDNFLFSQYR